MSAETTTTYRYVPAILRCTQIALPDGMSLGDDWGDRTDSEELAPRARIILRIPKLEVEKPRTQLVPGNGTRGR